MGIIFKIIIVIIGILVLISLTVNIIIFVQGIRYSKNISETWSNTLKCGKIFCESKIVDLPIPEQSGTDYNQVVARYCADLVYRIEMAEKEEYKPPPILTEELRMWNIKPDPFFGVLWFHENVVYIMFRGTKNMKEWMQDFTYEQKIFPKHEKISQQQITFLRDVSTPPHVHTGFLEVYNNFRDEVVAKLADLNPKQVIIGGHSLGAAVATICGLDLQLLGYNCIVYNFASPRVGDDLLCDLVNSSKLPLYRIVNTTDVIPTLPPSVAPNFTDSSKPYFYVHCGVIVNFTSNWKSLINNHLLPPYIEFLQT